MKAAVCATGLCPCGYPLFNEDVRLGTEFEIEPESVRMGALICGGCGEKHAEVEWVYAHPRLPGQHGGYLPVAAFNASQQGERTCS